MKMLACASYDYMKLMVVELKQQIGEIEARERLTADRAAATAGCETSSGEPKAPPRTRHNPFNGGGAGAGKEKVRYTWLDLHQMYGEKVMRDREVWLQSREGEVATIAMNDDTLLVVL
jgi:hypothetical protein